jgi:hypothetical protein
MATPEINPGVDPHNPTPWRKRRSIGRLDQCLCWQLRQSVASGKDLPPHLGCENNCGLSTGTTGRQIVAEPGEYDARYYEGKTVEEICLFHQSLPEGIEVNL